MENNNQDCLSVLYEANNVVQKSIDFVEEFDPLSAHFADSIDSACHTILEVMDSLQAIPEAKYKLLDLTVLVNFIYGEAFAILQNSFRKVKPDIRPANDKDSETVISDTCFELGMFVGILHNLADDLKEWAKTEEAADKIIEAIDFIATSVYVFQEGRKDAESNGN